MMKLLVVVDVQNDFVDGSLGTEEAIEIIPYIRKKVENFVGEVVYTMDTHDENYLLTQEGKKLPVKHCLKGSQGWELRQGIYRENSKIFEKIGFGSTDLVDYIKVLGKAVESVELIGICTDICVVSNAILLKAHFPELPIIVDSKGCAGVTPQTHKNAIETMKMCQIEVI